MRVMHSARGFSLLEVLVATTTLLLALSAFAQLLIAAALAARRARALTQASVFAAQKLEALLPDGAIAGGLRASPPAALAENTDGYCDFLDAAGAVVGAGIGAGRRRRPADRRGVRASLVDRAVDRRRRDDRAACDRHRRAARRDRRARRQRRARGAVMRRDGFSLVEVTIATALTLVIASSIFALTRGLRAASAGQSELADVQQRMRVAVDTIAHDLVNAGAGPALVDRSGPLNTWIPAVLPFRRGMIASDPAGTVREDAITIVAVPTTAAQTLLTADAAPGSQTLQVARVPICAAGVNLCSFAAGMTILVFDDTGSFQIFTVAAWYSTAG